ncbi:MULTISPECIES: MFS transporter [Bacillaceae]|uniref:MFS transporter n=1 Tax=Bacillaceae TaxID=186817 RepID=UPI000C7627E1|nr:MULTISPECIES: MFS transporter [Bacillus]MDT0161210.1 MFS transporter [Bacillus sp. AG4(2022)]MDW2879656.1 MFS transporter [Bacillus infantis]PLR73152.1 MFS transporter [Bacillus sp. UMB0728]RYI28346.1 MFS transporter [Bacillus infantis]
MNSQRWMSRQFFSFFFTWGIFLPYWTGWMIHTKGMTVGQASLIMSLGLVVRGLSTLFAFPYLSGKFSSKVLINGMGIGTFVILLLCIPADSYSTLLAAVLFLHFFYPTLMPAMDTAAGVLVQHKQLKNYGKSRSWGSLGFIISGLILTMFTGRFGDGFILWGLLFGVFMLTCLGMMQAPDVLSQKPKADARSRGSLLRPFKAQHFGIVLVIVILLQAAHASYYNYGYIFLQEIDAPKYMIGAILNIGVVAEILFFLVADRVFRNVSPGSLLALAALGSTVRWILVFAFPNVAMFSVSQLLHALSFAMGHYAFMKYMIQYIPPKDVPIAQGIYSALALSWSTAVFTIFGGYLYEIEPRYAFLGMLVCTVPSLIVALVYRRMAHKQNIAGVHAAVKGA